MTNPVPTPITFTSKNQFGDFTWMIEQDLYNNTLFIFGDRVELLNSTSIGNGVTWIRRYTINNPQLSKPLSANIPIGSLRRGGYTSLTTQVINQINASINIIQNLISTYEYDNIYFDASVDNKIAVGNLNVSDVVRTYITDSLVNGI